MKVITLGINENFHRENLSRRCWSGRYRSVTAWQAKSQI